MSKSWDDILQNYASQNFQIWTQERANQISAEDFLRHKPASLATTTFLHYLANAQTTLWDAFFAGIQSMDANVQESTVFAPLRYLLARATRVAVLYGEHFVWKSPDQWSYLFEIAPLEEEHRYRYILAHPPATVAHIQQAETVLGTALPPSYVQFLQATNGLGIGTNEQYFICGAGEARAAWDDDVTFQAGVFTKPLYHEIASYWFQWQEIYAYEREQECETGVNTFRSDEKVCIAFASTCDDWCFDRSTSDARGEYPVVFWDHELREATLRYPDFASWFIDNVLNNDEE
jgi:hypothetical protein